MNLEKITEKVLYFLGIEEISDEENDNYRDNTPDEDNNVSREELSQRRDSRTGTILGVIAIIGSVIMFLFKVILKTLDVQVQNGIMYWWLLGILTCAFAVGGLVLLDILRCTFLDLLRYNILDKSHAKYDYKADKAYECLVDDFKYGIILLTIGVAMVIFIRLKYAATVWRVLFFAISGLCIFCLFVLSKWFRSDDSDEKVKKLKSHLSGFVIRHIYVFLFSLLIIATSMSSDYREISIDCTPKGNVDICFSSENLMEYKDITIKIEENERIIYENVICEDEMLQASDFNIVGFEYMNASLNEESVAKDINGYWRYTFDLKTVMEKDGRYKLIISQDGAEFINEFVVDEGGYTFARDEMVKQY